MPAPRSSERQPLGRRRQVHLRPNMPDYDRARADFSWAMARMELAGLPGGGLNIGYEAVDRHAAGELADTVALRCLDKRGGIAELTYAELKRRLTGSPACSTRSGCSAASACSSSLGRIPELYVAALGTLKHGACSARCSPPSAPSRSAQRLRARRRRGCWSPPPRSTAAKVAGAARRAARACARAARRRPTGSRRRRHAATSRALMAAADDREFEIPPTEPGGPGAAALHERHDRHAEGRRSTCTRPSSPTTPPARWRSTCTPTTSSGAPPTPAG